MQNAKRMDKAISPRSNQILYVLLAMSVFDALATDFGLRFDLLEEANPLVAYIYEESPFCFYTLKIGLPLSLFPIQSAVGCSRIVERLLQLSVVLYTIIFGLHIFWIVLHLS